MGYSYTYRPPSGQVVLFLKFILNSSCTDSLFKILTGYKWPVTTIQVECESRKMAARLACSRARIVAYMPSMSAAVRHFRAFSSFDEKQPPKQTLADIEALVRDRLMEWPDTRLGELSPKDPRFPLPGTVGPAPKLTKKVVPKEPDILTEPLPQERRGLLLQQYLETAEEDEDDVTENVPTESLASSLGIEVVAQELPELLKRDFQSLFPEQDLSRGRLTVITLSQHTENNMTMWSPET